MISYSILEKKGMRNRVALLVFPLVSAKSLRYIRIYMHIYIGKKDAYARLN